MTTAQTKPDSISITMLASGLADQISNEPLVSVYPTDPGGDTFQLVIHTYIADGIIPQLSEDFDTLVYQNTEAGNILVRKIFIEYEQPSDDPTTWSLWNFNIIYTVEGESADAIYVVCKPLNPQAPETSRGTVTTVTTT